MFTDEQLESKVRPIAARQEQLNIYTLKTIATRVDDGIELATATEDKKRRRMQDDLNSIWEEMYAVQIAQLVAIEKLLLNVAQSDYSGMKEKYKAAGVSFVRMSDNADIKRVVDKSVKQAQSNYKKMMESPKILLRDPKNPKIIKPMTIKSAYRAVVSRSESAARAYPDIDYNQSMRSTIRQLSDSGLREVMYSDDGRRYSRELENGIEIDLTKELCDLRQDLQNVVGKQLGNDGVEISVHAYPAPDQGHQFTLEEFEKLQNGVDFMDTDGEFFLGFPRAIGEYNCRHYTWSIRVGVTPPNYTKEELQEILQKNEAGHLFEDGSHLTMYECSQRQRAMERKIRKLKAGYITAIHSGDLDLSDSYRTRYIKMQKTYANYCKNVGLNPRFERTKFGGI